MKAAIFYGRNNIGIEEIGIPQISDEEMLIKIKVCAVCGTDLRIFKFGHHKIPEGVKRVLGHEISGEIVEIGSKINGYKLGMRVAISPNVGCGTCPMCIKGFNQLCPEYKAFGISMDGGFQEYLKIPAFAIKSGNVIPIADNITFEEAALAEPFSCCYNSYEALETKPGETVLIIGAGPIGALHVMINKLAGACKIIVADISQQRLDKIKKLGADVIINSSKTDLTQEVFRETNGMGANVIIVACSEPDMQKQALEMVSVHGRINFFGGLPKGKEEVVLNTNIVHYKEVKILGTTGSNIFHFHKALQIISSKKVDLKFLISEEFTIEETVKAFEYASSSIGMKVLVVNK